MQIVFETDCSISEYAEKGISFPFPLLRLCPGCTEAKPHKHGFYWRHCLDGFSSFFIPIRRYHCTRCGITISFLPSFCLPGFHYALDVIWKALELRLGKGYSLRECLSGLLGRYPGLDWLPQRVSYYAKRFLENLPWLEATLRGVFPRTKLDLDKEKRAKKVLAIVQTGFRGIQSFAKLFFEQRRRSLLAPLR